MFRCRCSVFPQLIRLLDQHSGLKSSLHPLLPLVRSASGVMSEDDVARARRAMAATASSAAAGSAATPRRSASGLPPAATPLSPSIPQSAWSRMVSRFTRSLESLQSAGQLSDESALQLIDLFQARNAAVVAACEVLELDGNVAEFEDTLRVIVAEHAELAQRSPRTRQRLQQRMENTNGDEAPRPPNGAADRPVQSFAARVQSVGDRDSDAEFDEDAEESGDVADSSDIDVDVDRLLNKSDDEVWGADDVEALYSKVLQMTNELNRLRLAQRQEEGGEGEEEEEEEEEQGEDDDDFDEEEEEEEDEEEEEQ